MNYRNLIILITIIIILSIPRWNRQDLLIKDFVGKELNNYAERTNYRDINFSTDSYQYLQYINYFNGMEVDQELSAPYTYRPLLPYIASLMPFDEFSSLNILNLLFAIAGLVALFLLLKALDLDDNTIFKTGLLYAFSFPIFYYNVVGLIDSSIIAALLFVNYLMVKERIIGVLLMVMGFVFAKETIILVIPMIFIYYFLKREYLNGLVFGGAALVMYLLLSALIRLFISPSIENYIWTIDWYSINYNLGRPKAFISVFITGFFPMLFGHFGVKHSPKNVYFKTLRIMIVFALLLVIYSFMTAYADGRFIWYVYPYALPFAAYFFKSRENKI